MGTPKLKIKAELNYRPGYTHAHCSQCNFYVSSLACIGISIVSAVGDQPRCKIIGLNPGRMYRISPNNICDKYDGSESIARIKRGMSI